MLIRDYLNGRNKGEVSTDQNPNEGLDCKSIVLMRRWTHITVSFSQQLLHLLLMGY